MTFSAETMTAHRFTWYAVDPGTGERIRRTRHMNGRDWGVAHQVPRWLVESTTHVLEQRYVQVRPIAVLS